jgi:hypothetical protein
MFVSGLADHIPYSRVDAALRVGDLGFIRRHRASLTLGLVDEIRVAELLAAQDLAALEAQALECVRRFAVEASKPELDDYLRIVTAFRTMASRPELATGQLLALCAARGIE